MKNTKQMNDIMNETYNAIERAICSGDFVDGGDFIVLMPHKNAPDSIVLTLNGDDYELTITKKD